jgi:biotin carboxylase
MSSTRSPILIVGCGFPQLSLIRRARALGFDVLGLDGSKEAPGIADCTDFVQVSTADADAIVEVIEARGIEAIATTGSELALKTTAIAAHRTSLPFATTPETVRRCQEKDAMRAAYEAGHVAVPPFASCASLADAEAFAAQNPYPFVVKPVRGWGQRGVARVDDHADLVEAVADALHHGANAGLAQVVIERWIEGGEYSVTGWIEHGELVAYAVTERIKVPGKKPLGVMVAEVAPSGLTPAAEALVIEEARKGAKALGLTRGPCYSQVAFDDVAQRAYLFETAARMGGGFDADVARIVSGVDLYDRILGIAVGDSDLENSSKTATAHGAGIVKFHLGKPGIVTAKSGLDDARRVEGVLAAELFPPVGATVHPLTDSAKRTGYVLVEGPSRSAVERAADRALAAMILETRP